MTNTSRYHPAQDATDATLTIKSWMFDSTGGHGDALWFAQDDAWIVEAARVLADGGRATSTNVYSVEGVDAFVWEVTNFEINGEPQPDVSLRMVRQKDGPPESE